VIRVRLTAWYVALLALILSGFSGYLYVSFARDMHEELARSLASEADRLIANIELESGQPQFGEGSETLPPGMLATVHDPAGNLLEAADPRQAEPETANGWAVLSRPVVIDGVELGVLTVARSEADTEAAVHELLVLMLLAVPLTLALASAGGLFLAGRALAPIDRITRTAASIGVDDLSRRLAVRSTDEVGRLARTFDDMLARLERAFQRQRQFTSDASHELRTPLTLLASQIDVALERRRTPAEYQRVLSSLRADTTRMSQLVGELLTLARADDGQQLLSAEPLDLANLVHSVVDTMQPLAEQRGVRLTQAVDSTSLVHGDQTRLSQLLINVVDNGLRYTPRGGTVAVGVGLENTSAVVRVSDTGVGIAADHLPHVFERFYRVDAARARADGGSGLGLAICRWIAEAHGGSLAVNSELERGSTFTLRLPRFT
jgi:heavy metal sensor kinase